MPRTLLMSLCCFVTAAAATATAMADFAPGAGQVSMTADEMCAEAHGEVVGHVIAQHCHAFEAGLMST